MTMRRPALLAFGAGGGPRRHFPCGGGSRRGLASDRRDLDHRPSALPGATFHAEINPKGSATTYRFEYITDAAYQENPPAERFNGAAKAPTSATPPAPARAPPSTAGQPVRQRPARRHHLPLPAQRHQRLRDHSQRRSSPSPPRNSAAPPPCPTTAAGSWSPRPKKTAARSRAPKGSTAAASSRPPLPAKGLSPTPPPPPSVATSPGRPTRLPVHLHAARSGLVDRRTSPPRPSPAPTATNPTASPTSSSPRPRPRADAERRPLPRRRHEMPGRQPAPARLRRPRRLPGLLPARRRQTAPTPPLLTEANARTRPLRTEEFNLAFAGASPDLRHVVLSTCAALTPGRPKSPGPKAATRPSKPL